MRPAWGAAALMSCIPRVVRSWSHDVSLLQREFLSTLVTLEGFARRPRILDVDDAIFLHRDGRTARRLAQLCEGIVCGNTFLAEWFVSWNPNVAVVPTAIDTEAYAPRGGGATEEGPTIGWIGTSGNLRYLIQVEGALRMVMALVPQARLLVVTDTKPTLDLLPPSRVEFVRWTEEGEIADLQRMDVGIMPLEDSLWARGKCSFKMLQYLACGIPVVVSPVGMNAEVLSLGECGFGARSEREWVDALVALLTSRDLRERLGRAGRGIAETAFSVDVVAPRLAACLSGRWTNGDSFVSSSGGHSTSTGRERQVRDPDSQQDGTAQ